MQKACLCNFIAAGFLLEKLERKFMKRRRSLFLHFNQLRVLLRKFALVTLFIISLILMLMSKNQSILLDYASSGGSYVAMPVIQVLIWPAKMVTKGYEYLTNLWHIQQDNEALRAENEALHKLQNKYDSLEIENKLLSDLLNYVTLPQAGFISAKMVAEERGVFAHAIVAYVGDKQVNKGDVVLANGSVVGRIDKQLQSYAKVILLTDISSNIPVIIENTRIRGILKGDNSQYPKLVFTPLDAEISVGDRIVTSGVSGVFPAGLPIGYVHSIVKNEIKVRLFASLEKLEYVKIVNYNIGGLLEDIDND